MPIQHICAVYINSNAHTLISFSRRQQAVSIHRMMICRHYYCAAEGGGAGGHNKVLACAGATLHTAQWRLCASYIMMRGGSSDDAEADVCCVACAHDVLLMMLMGSKIVNTLIAWHVSL